MTPFHQTNLATIYCGDALETLKQLPNESVQCCVTSPPYWALRDYGTNGQIGLEATPDEYVAKMVDVFSEVFRVLSNVGTCWVNMGDCYATGAGKVKDHPGGGKRGQQWRGSREGFEGKQGYSATSRGTGAITQPNRMPIIGLKPKDLVGMPWRIAFALQASGWYLRSDIIWHKPNPLPESVTDRPTKSHEYIFLLTKQERYYYDASAIKESVSQSTHARLSQNVQDQIGSERANGGAKTNGNMKAVGRTSWNGSEFHTGKTGEHQLGRSSKNRKTAESGSGIKNNESFDEAMAIMPEFRNKRTVWTVPTYSYRDAHFATFPPDLIRPCILAGSRLGDVVIDPFAGSGTTGQVSLEHGRKFLGIELNPDYCRLIVDRTNVTPGLPL